MPPSKRALLIGNANYSAAVNRLNDPISNVKKLADILRKIGFEIVQCFDANKRQMTVAFQEFAETIKDGDLVLVYLCGHGFQTNGVNYIIPIDDESVKAEIDLETFTVNFDRVVRRFSKANSSYVTIFILDCCRPYSLNNIQKSASKTSGSGLAKLTLPDGIFIQFACDANKVVNDAPGTICHGLYTEQLLQNIARENTEAFDVFESISNAVNKSSNGQQKPLSLNNIRRHREVFLNKVKVQPIIEFNEVTRDLAEIIAEQKILRAYYNNFPNLSDVVDNSRPAFRSAEQLTKEILSNRLTGNLSERDALCHVLYRLMGDAKENCTFFDSSQGMNLHDASTNLVDLSFQERPFVLQLNTVNGLANMTISSEKENDIKLYQMFNDRIQQNRPHPVLEDIQNRLAKAHNVAPNRINLSKVYQGSLSVAYSVNSKYDEIIPSLSDLPKNIAREFRSIKGVKVHPLLFRPCFDISQFDPRGNKTFGDHPDTYEVGPPGRTQKYIQPARWTRYGLRVLGRYQDDLWLDPFGNPNNWYRAYHGTRRASSDDFKKSGKSFEKSYAPLDAMASIHNTGFQMARVHAYGEGVYCSPDPTFPEKDYVGIVEIPTQCGQKRVKCMLQVAVNPDGVNQSTEKIWVVGIPENIRPYGILIKEA